MTKRFRNHSFSTANKSKKSVFLNRLFSNFIHIVLYKTKLGIPHPSQPMSVVDKNTIIGSPNMVVPSYKVTNTKKTPNDPYKYFYFNMFLANVNQFDEPIKITRIGRTSIATKIRN